MIVYMVEEKFANFREKLDVYVHLREGDKLMRNGNTMYSEPPGFLQSWKRWWYKENHETTFQYLDEDFTEFMKFLDKDMKIYVEYTDKVIEYIKSIIPGLHSLKLTYPNYKKLHFKVDSIILTLLDFKKEVRTCKTREPYLSYSF